MSLGRSGFAVDFSLCFTWGDSFQTRPDALAANITSPQSYLEAQDHSEVLCSEGQGSRYVSAGRARGRLTCLEERIPENLSKVETPFLRTLVCLDVPKRSGIMQRAPRPLRQWI